MTVACHREWLTGTKSHSVYTEQDWNVLPNSWQSLNGNKKRVVVIWDSLLQRCCANKSDAIYFKCHQAIQGGRILMESAHLVIQSHCCNWPGWITLVSCVCLFSWGEKRWMKSGGGRRRCRIRRSTPGAPHAKLDVCAGLLDASHAPLKSTLFHIKIFKTYQRHPHWLQNRQLPWKLCGQWRSVTEILSPSCKLCFYPGEIHFPVKV